MISNPLRKGRSKYNKRHYLNLFIILIILGVFLFVLSDYFGFIYDGFNFAVIPVKTFSYTITSDISGFFSGLGNISNLENKNISLKMQLKSAQSKIVTLERYKQENSYLKNQLDSNLSKNKYIYVPSQILYYGPTGVFGYVYISTSSNIKVGDPVIYKNYLIGKVTVIYNQYAKVMLISNVNMNVPVYVKNYNAILTGSLSNSLILNDITQLDKISVGDIVLTSGLDSTFPKNLIVGYINYISQDSSSVLRTVDVSNAINVNDLKYVFVLTTKKS